MIHLKLLLMALFWGGTFVAGKIAAQSMGPFSAAFLRFFMATLFLLPLTLMYEKRLPLLTGRRLALVASLGCTGVFAYNYFFFSGLHLINASRAAVIIATQPIFIALFSAFLFGEAITPIRGFGIILSVCGAIVVISRGNPAALLHGAIGPGELFIFGGVASWVTYSLIGKVAMKELPPFATVTYAAGMGMLGLFVPACLEGMPAGIASYPPSAWLSLAYLAFFGTAVAFTWYYQGIGAIGPSRAGVFINFVPVSAVILSLFLLSESLSWSLLTGLIMVTGGVFMANRKPANA